MFWLIVLITFGVIFLLCLWGAALVKGGMRFGTSDRANLMPEPPDEHGDYTPGP